MPVASPTARTQYKAFALPGTRHGKFVAKAFTEAAGDGQSVQYWVHMLAQFQQPGRPAVARGGRR